MVNDAHLLAGDRLEPSESIPDVGSAFDELQVFPVVAVFWRLSRETICRHRNPLFDSEIGMGSQECLTIDALHSLRLGPMLVFNTLCTWRLLKCGIRGSAEDTGSEALQVAVLCLQMIFARSIMNMQSHIQNPS